MTGNPLFASVAETLKKAIDAAKAAVENGNVTASEVEAQIAAVDTAVDTAKKEAEEVLWSILSGTTEIEVECQSAPSQNIIPKISALTTARSCGDFSFMAQCIRVAPTSRNGRNRISNATWRIIRNIIVFLRSQRHIERLINLIGGKYCLFVHC